MPQSDKKRPLSHTLLAGGIAGFVESSVCHPLDTIKTRMQLRNNHIESVGTRLKHSLIEPAVFHMRHSFVEPALRMRHSLVDPALRVKHSLVEPANMIIPRLHSCADPSLMYLNGLERRNGSTSATANITNMKSGTSKYKGSDAISLKTHGGTATNGAGGRGITTSATTTRSSSVATNSAAKCWWNTENNASKSPNRTYQSRVATNSASSGRNDAATCWWNQQNQPHVKNDVADTSKRLFQQRIVMHPSIIKLTQKRETARISTSKNAIKCSTRSDPRPNSTAWWNWHKHSPSTIAGRGQSSKSSTWWQPMVQKNQHGRRTHATLISNSTSNIVRKGSLGPIETARKIIQREGFWSLYKGLSAVYVGIIPKMAIRFVSFEQYKDVIKIHGSFGEKATNFTAGLLTGLTEAVLIVTPADVCKIRMQSQRHSMLDPAETQGRKYGNVVQTAATIIREEGWGALYKGVVPTMLRQGCNQAVNFTAYNAMKKYWIERQQQQYLQQNGNELPGKNQQLSGAMSLLIGGSSGAMGPIINNPLDVVKTRLQKQNTTKNIHSGPKYTGLVQACFKIASEEGAGALWKGITPRLMRIVPGQAITFTTYEAVCRWLKNGP